MRGTARPARPRAACAAPSLAPGASPGAPAHYFRLQTHPAARKHGRHVARLAQGLSLHSSAVLPRSAAPRKRPACVLPASLALPDQSSPKDRGGRQPPSRQRRRRRRPRGRRGTPPPTAGRPGGRRETQRRSDAASEWRRGRGCLCLCRPCCLCQPSVPARPAARPVPPLPGWLEPRRSRGSRVRRPQRGGCTQCAGVLGSGRSRCSRPARTLVIACPPRARSAPPSSPSSARANTVSTRAAQ